MSSPKKADPLEKSKKNPHGLTLPELQLAAACLFSTKDGALNIDYDKLTYHGGYANANSARASISATLKKFRGFMAATPGNEDGDGSAKESGDEETPKAKVPATPKRKANKAAANGGSPKKRTKKEIKAEEAASKAQGAEDGGLGVGAE